MTAGTGQTTATDANQTTTSPLPSRPLFYNVAMPLNETDMRAEPIGPALHRRGHGKTDKEHRTASRMMFENNYRKESERLTRN